MAFSQAHTPQANGKAEVAGKVVRDIMQKLYVEEARSWVLLLPMAIRIWHDTVDPEICYSPYQLVFGMEKPGFGIPWTVVRECREAAEWMADREKLELEAGSVLRKRIFDGLRRAGQGRPMRVFKEGDRVWLKNPQGITGPGLNPIGLEPCLVTEQFGEHSFKILTGKGKQATHASQLKLCVKVGGGKKDGSKWVI